MERSRGVGHLVERVDAPHESLHSHSASQGGGMGVVLMKGCDSLRGCVSIRGCIDVTHESFTVTLEYGGSVGG